jgi:ribosomal protein L37AE/L43A
MSIIESIEESHRIDDLERKKRQDKFGNYDNPENGCPNCGRYRIMIGKDKKHRCEKCSWCLEDKAYDVDMSL